MTCIVWEHFSHLLKLCILILRNKTAKSNLYKFNLQKLKIDFIRNVFNEVFGRYLIFTGFKILCKLGIDPIINIEYFDLKYYNWKFMAKILTVIIAIKDMILIVHVDWTW